jgi:transcriptional regulator with XRE-family HTH domain
MNKGRKAPRSSRSDRDYIPAALRNWRKAHGLSQKQAQARIGMSSKTNSWGLWESGLTAPTYKNLLKIIATTGLGHWLDEERRRDMDPTIRFEADVVAERKARRDKRKRELG